MDNILIYPYNRAYLPYVRHQSLMTDFRIASAVSPRGWGMIGDKIRFLEIDLVVNDDFTNSLTDCSTVWFVEDDKLPLPRALLYDKIKQAIDQNKKIIYTRYSSHEEYLEAMSLIPQDLNITPHINNFNEAQFLAFQESKQWFDNAAPVLFVVGVAESTDKFEVQAALRRQFMAMDYNVTSISSRRDSDILGIHPMPDFMWNTNVNEEEKILRFKWFVKQLEMEEQPDIIIVGIPGGVIPYSRRLNNHFCVFMFEISMAIECDCAVLCSFSALYEKENLNDLSRTIQNKFDFPVEYHHISSYICASEESHFPGEFNLISISEKSVKELASTYKAADDNVYFVSEDEESYRLAENIINNLSNTNILNLPII